MATALSCINVSAQNTTSQGEFTYKRGATYVESTLPSTPQASSIVKYSDVPFLIASERHKWTFRFTPYRGKN